MSHTQVPMFKLLVIGLLFAVPCSAASQVSNTGSVHSWTLSPSPVIEIGAAEHEGPDLFGQVVGVVRTSDGHIAVADGLTRELRVFDLAGQHIATAGRVGEGPGEFRTMRPPMRCAEDSVFVWDPNLQRVSVFTSAGDYARSFRDASVRAAHPDWPGWKMTCNREGVVVASTRNVSDLRPVHEGPTRIEMGIQLTSLRSGAGVDLGRVPGDEFYFAQGTLAPRPLGMMTLVAIGSSRIYVSTGDDFRISVFTLDGDRLDPIGEPLTRVPLNRRRVDAFIDEAVRTSRNGEKARSFYQGLEYPDKLPCYSQLLVDPDENLWVELYAEPGDHGGRSWRVYDREGSLESQVQMPRGFEVFEVGGDYVLGVWRNDVGVDFVRMYNLTKPD